MMRVNVTQPFLPPIEEFYAEIEKIWDKKWLTNAGPLENELSSSIQQYLKVENVDLGVNGHIALENILLANDLKGEVITTPFTFVSTIHAIKLAGLTPVFCDINDTDFTMDVTKIEALITENTSAILPVHVYGNPCDVSEIDRIAKKHNLKVIYDAAHAFGVEINQKGIGTFGDASMFSFHATKCFNTIEGGCITYSDQKLEKKIKLLKNFGIENEEEISMVGRNCKMNEFQAAMGIVNLRYIDDCITKREVICRKYNSFFEKYDWIKTPNYTNANIKYNFAYYPIILENGALTRDELYAKLAEKNVYSRKYFWPVLNELDIFKECVGETPVAAKIGRNVLCLPLYSEMEEETIEYVLETLRNILD